MKSTRPSSPRPAAAARTPPRHVSRSNNNLDKHAEIFAAAVRIFREKGYHGASMQDIADAVGLQKASLYYYFKSKQDLLVLVFERGTGAVTETLEGIVQARLSPTDKLRRAIHAYLVALCAQLELFTVFLREQKFLAPKHKARLRGEGERHADLLEAIIREGIRAGEFRETDAKMVTHAILGMCNWLYEWYSPDGPLTPEEIAALYAELAIDGLAQRQDVRR